MQEAHQEGHQMIEIVHLVEQQKNQKENGRGKVTIDITQVNFIEKPEIKLVIISGFFYLFILQTSQCHYNT